MFAHAYGDLVEDRGVPGSAAACVLDVDGIDRRVSQIQRCLTVCLRDH